MQLEFPKEINKNKSKFLLAISGGVDSMVLLALFNKEKLKFSVAHMNFNLREESSEADQKLVEKQCEILDIECFTKKVNTQKYKKDKGISTQMAARDLRYNWLNQLCEDKGFNYLVTAHHADDQVETFFINLLRKSGSKGLSAMQTLNSNLWRPLLNYTKKEIYTYAVAQDIEWREDASNHSNDYLRNKLRNRIIPLFNEVNPQAVQIILESTKLLHQENVWIENQVECIKKRLFKPLDEKGFSISIKQLEKIEPLDTSLHYLFSPFGFHSPPEIKKLMDAENSAEVNTKTHRLVKERGSLLLYPKQSKILDKIELEIGKKYHDPINITLTKSLKKNNTSRVSFDFNRLKFPLYLRYYKNGDKFCPSGMKGKSQKVSKYFKDNKFSKIEKEQTLLLVDALDQIIWVVGHRQDERFISNKNTEIWLHVEV